MILKVEPVEFANGINVDYDIRNSKSKILFLKTKK